ncbi:MAG: mechanosensitive ion channel family protein [Polyangiaceae bacterium]
MARRSSPWTGTLVFLVVLVFSMVSVSREAHAAGSAPSDIAKALGLSAQKEGDAKTESGEDKETVAPDSPRAAMDEFFGLTRQGRFGEAGKFLQIPGSMQNAPDVELRLTEELDAVLRRHIKIDIDALSPSASGNPSDGLPNGVDEFGKIPSEIRGRAPESVRIVRVNDETGKGRWLFARSTVERVPRWYDELPDRWLRGRLPRALLRVGPRGIMMWQWIALPLLFAAAWLVGQAASGVTRRVVRFVFRSHPALSDKVVLATFAKPVAYAWAFVLTSVALQFVAFDAGPEERIQAFLKAGVVGSFFWGLVRSVDVVVAGTQKAPWAFLNPATAALLPLLGKILKLALFVVGAFECLSIVGVEVTSIVAGLGIGGLAVALAAQKTVENLFGAVTLALDEPFRIGDYITVDGVSGTVESLGLRSTRIRTPDRTLITMPNAKVAEMRIENFAHRDRFRLRESFALDVDTPRASIDALTGTLVQAFAQHPNLGPDKPLVTLRGVAGGALVVEMLGWFLADGASDFERIRDAFMRDAVDHVRAAGVEFAAIETLAKRATNATK